MRIVFLITGIGICLVLSACTSLVAHKIPSNGALPVAKTGIPYQMTRPEYTIDILPNADDPTQAVYTLNKADVPDSTQRYTIVLDAGLLTDGGFELNLGPAGNLSKGTATITSNAVATLEAVSGASVNLIKAAALKDESSALGTYREHLSNNSDLRCTTQNGNNKEVRKALEARVEKILEAGHDVLAEAIDKNRDPKLVINLFHYFDSQEQACLKAVDEKIQKGNAENLQTLEKDYLGKKGAAEKNVTEDINKTNLKRIGELVDSKSLGELRRLGNSLKKATKEEGVVYGVYQNAENYLVALDAPIIKQMSTIFVNMPDKMWRARHLMLTELLLARSKTKLLQALPSERAEYQRDIRMFESNLRTTMDEELLFARLYEFNKFLSEVKASPTDGSKALRYAADEHIKIREERDRLQAQLDKKRFEIIAGNAAPVPSKDKVKPSTGLQTRLVKKSFIDAVNSGQAKSITDTPPYVVVLETIDGSLDVDCQIDKKTSQYVCNNIQQGVAK